MPDSLQTRFIEPLDVLYLRGNKLFGGGGDHAQALMPPWPSLIAGALRSRMLSDANIDMDEFHQNRIEGELEPILGTPVKPGSFEIGLFSVARQQQDRLECFYPMPADLFLPKQNAADNPLPDASYLHPQTEISGIKSSRQLQNGAVLKTAQRSKPESGYWLRQTGWARYHQGESIRAQDMIAINELWQTDQRLGIALDEHSNTAAESKIYTTEVIQFMPQTGFVTCVKGAEQQLPDSGLLRLGADGHAASIQTGSLPEQPGDWQRIENQQRFKVITTTPGLFANGWLPPGIDPDNQIFKFGNSQARLVCASLNRSQVISGWDLANWKPKDAHKSVAVGTVYWFDNFNGDVQDLQQLQQQGFWQLAGFPDRQRQAEGFNQLTIAPWAKQQEEA